MTSSLPHMCFVQTKCFICGIGSDYFDTTPHGFETHTFDEHNLANYMWVDLHVKGCAACVRTNEKNINTQILFRFFLMYLINKDETEHTGQVSNCFLYCFKTSFFISFSSSFQTASSCSHVLCFRSHTCGRCTKSVAGTFSLLETVSESNTRINFPSQ